ncbi:MAG: hypothetical protein A3C47_00150 [Omnitrophica bacterium RIFCSPHIGHO2_02_FULL_51_18]|nr:MAG: hypothetical protein A3C47_00150 [Omnitrophica bacterium RIFCSPHIGHO2_02_FULL_51_18]
MTLISLCFGILSGVFLAQGTYACFILGALCFQIAMILDNCDGNIARAKNMKSEFGAWLDIFVDLLIDILFFAGLTLGVQKINPSVPAILLGSLCIAGSIINCVVVSAEKVRGFGPAVFNTPHPRGTNRKNIFFKIIDAIREGDSSWFVLLFALFGKMDFLLAAGAVYIQILWLSAVLMNFKWLK